MALVVSTSLHERTMDPLLNMVEVRLSTGAEEGLVDVQPNGHFLVFVNLSRLPPLMGCKDGDESGDSRESSTYGSGVNHGSPLNVRAFDSPTMLASRLCRLEPGLTRSCVEHNFSTGVFVNPILLEDEKEARYVGIRIGDEIN